MSQQLELELDLPLARVADPETSHSGGDDVRVRVGSQRAILLQSYYDNPEGLTATEAAEMAGVSLLSCYWKRCSELRQGHYISTLLDERGAPVTRINPHSGSRQEVCVITSKGRSWTSVNGVNE